MKLFCEVFDVEIEARWCNSSLWWGRPGCFEIQGRRDARTTIATTERYTQARRSTVNSFAIEPSLHTITGMVSRISISDATGRLDDLADRVRAGEEFVVERGGQDVLRIGPVQPRQMFGRDLIELLRGLPAPDSKYFDDVESVTRDQGEPPIIKWE